MQLTEIRAWRIPSIAALTSAVLILLCVAVIKSSSPTVICHAIRTGLQVRIERLDVCETGDCRGVLTLSYDRNRVPLPLRFLAPSAITIDETTLPWLPSARNELIVRSTASGEQFDILEPLVHYYRGTYIQLLDGDALSGSQFFRIVEISLPLSELQVMGVVTTVICLPGSRKKCDVEIQPHIEPYLTGHIQLLSDEEYGQLLNKE